METKVNTIPWAI